MMPLHRTPIFCKVFIRNPVWGCQSSHAFQLGHELPPLAFYNHPSSDHMTFKNGFVASFPGSHFRGGQE